MGITLKLYTGLIIKNADKMLSNKFEELPWSKYDGDKPKNPNVINPKKDINRLYQLKVRTSRQTIASMVIRNSANLTYYLKQIPVDIALENADLLSLQKPIIGLYKTVFNSKGIKLATGTKLLYPFRPLLLPVIDSVLENYYLYAISIRDETSFRRLKTAYQNTLELYAYEIIRLLQKDLISVSAKLDEIRKLFVKKDYGKASMMRILESLIWYYYAREGSEKIYV